MATPTFFEPGSDATGGVEFYTSITGAVTSSTTITRSGSGPRVIKCDATATPANAYVQKAAVLAQAGRRMSVWMYLTGLPTSGASGILRAQTSAAAECFSVTISSANKIRVQNGATVLATGATTVALNTGFRLACSYVITSTSNYTIKVWLDGVLELTVTQAAGSLTNVAADALRIGWIGTSPAANALLYFRDVYVDDGTTLDDPGDMRVTNKKPVTSNSAGFDNNGVSMSGAARVTAVSQVPINTTTLNTDYIWHAATSDVTESFTLQGVGVGDVDITGKTIVGRTAWIWHKVSSTTGTAAWDIINNGTTTAMPDATGTAYILSTNTVNDAVYPSNAAGVGMTSSVIAADTFLGEAGMLIAYNAVTVTTIALAATGSVSVTGTATAAVLVPMSATGSVAVTGSAALLVRVPMAATGSVTVTGSAALLVRVPMAATGAVSVSGSGLLSGVAPTAPLAATGTVSIGGNGSLAVLVPLVASQSVIVTGSGALLVRVPMVATGSVTVTGSAALLVRVPMAATGSVTVTGSGALKVFVPMQATGAVTVTGSANLLVRVPLSASQAITVSGISTLRIVGANIVDFVASGAVTVTGTGAVLVRVPLSATGSVSVSGSATLLVRVPLSATGSVSVDGSASLLVYVPLSGSGLVEFDGTAQLAVLVPLSATEGVLVIGSGLLEIADLEGIASLHALGLIVVSGEGEMRICGVYSILDVFSAGDNPPIVYRAQGTVYRAGAGVIRARGGVIRPGNPIINRS